MAKIMIRDKARIQTDKTLERLDTEIGRVYTKSPALLAVEREYAKYMREVKDRTNDLYRAYTEEQDKDIKAKKKKAYMDELERYTLKSDKYNKLVKKIAGVLAEVNQQALDLINDQMVNVYVENYNAVADECKKAGIEINGNE